MSNKKYGYARVSSTEQNLSRQLDALIDYGVLERDIITDKVSGQNLNRPGYDALRNSLLRPGDTLVIKSLDRLSRTKYDIKNELLFFKNNSIRLIVLDLPTTTIDLPEEQSWMFDMINNILIEVLSSIAENERVTIKKRQSEGVVSAKKQGKHLGRPKMDVPDNFNEVYQEYKAGAIKSAQAIKELGIPKSTFYKLLKDLE